MDGAGDGGPDDDDEGEALYRRVSGPVGSMHRERVELIAETWGRVLGAAAPEARLSVRVVGGRVPMVRSECCVSGLAVLVDLLCKAPEGGVGLVGPAPTVRRVRGEVLDDLSRLNPGWVAVVHGADYLSGARDADGMTVRVEAGLARLLPGGAVGVAPACWQDGTAWVRIDLEPESAEWMTSLVRALMGWDESDGEWLGAAV